MESLQPPPGISIAPSASSASIGTSAPSVPSTIPIRSRLLKMYSVKIAIACILFIAVFPISTVITRILRRILPKTIKEKKNFIYIDFGFALLKYVIIFFAFIASLKIVNLNISFVFGALGILGLGVSLALQDSMKDFVAGLFLIFFNYFGTNDTVRIDDVVGRIQQFRLFSTTVLSSDNIRIEVPNSQIWKHKFINYSRRKYVNFIFTMNISNGNDLDNLVQTMIEFLKKHRVNEDPHATRVTLENDVNLRGDLRMSCVVTILSDKYEETVYVLPVEARIALQKNNFVLSDSQAVPQQDLQYKSGFVDPIVLE